MMLLGRCRNVGVVSGIVGIGGGILFVPALIWLAGMDQHRAQGNFAGRSARSGRHVRLL